jgi:anti-sigma factor RsiW
MMNRDFENLNESDERIELLISRALDGELAGDDRAEFESLLRTNPDAQALFESYENIDATASSALHADFAGHARYNDAQHATGHNGRSIQKFSANAPLQPNGIGRQLRVGVGAALLAAAAVIVIASLPISQLSTWFSPSGNRQSISMSNNGQREWPPAPERGSGAPMLVDYQTPVYQPQRMRGDVFRDLIGVQGDDPNVIIFLERQTRAARVETVSGDI